MTILDAVRHWTATAPEQIAHVSGDRSLTYGDLGRQSDTLASYFLHEFASAEPHQPIAFYGHKEPEMLIGFLAAVKSGHPYVPIDVTTPAPRVDYIRSASRALAVLTPAEIAARTGDPGSAEPVQLDTAPEVRGDDPFYIMFTSGSTGDPKGVVITCRNLQTFVDWMVQEQRFADRGEVFLDQAPFSFDLSVMDLYPCLVTGNTLFSLHKDVMTNPAQLFRTLAGSPITTWVSTPSFARLCLVEKTFAAAMLPRMTRFLFCGETLSLDVARMLLARFPGAAVWNTYGPTEATVATTSMRIDEPMLRVYRSLPVGYPKPDSRLLIVDEADLPLPEGQHGQIVIVGANVSPGYVGRPDLTENAFFEVDGMPAYRTGDQGYLDQGLLFFEGRRDNQIKLHGHRIEIGDVEANLQALPHVRDALVIVRTRDGVPDSLSAFVIYDNAAELSDFERAQILRRQLAERVPAYMVPHRFHFLDSFPMTANGKADRRKLAEIQR